MGFLSKIIRARVTPSAARGATGAAAAEHARRHAMPPALAQQPMNLIQVPDLSRKLVTRYGIREKAPAPTLSTEVVPVVLVDDLIGESDLVRPRIRPASGFQELTTAANSMVSGLVNPNGSRVVAHLYYFVITNTTNTGYQIHFTGTPTLATVSTNKGFRNGLMSSTTGLPQSPVCFLSGNVPGVSPGGGIEGFVQVGNNLNVILPFDAVLDEGQGVQFFNPTAVTTTVRVTAFWTEEDKV